MMPQAIRRHVNFPCLLTTLALTTATLLTLSVGIAQAESSKLVFYGNFSDGPFPHGIGVDQNTGNVFVNSFESGQIQEYSASGEALSSLSGAPGFYGGLTVSPTNGDVYVLNGETEAIEAYEPSTGHAVGAPCTVESFEGVLGVLEDGIELASDAAGHIYVPIPGKNEVLEYDPSSCTLERTFTDSGELKAPNGIAIDSSSGNLWVADSGDNRIVELEPTGGPVEVNGRPVEIKSEGVQAVAVDNAGDVFATVYNAEDLCGSTGSGDENKECDHLIEYGPKGETLADVGAGAFGEYGFPIKPLMIAVDDKTGRVYAADGFKELVWMYGPPTAPIVGNELTAELEATEAKLGALINPGGAATSYRFQYGTSAEYGSEAPAVAGNVGESLEVRTVWAAASGLAPNTTYHYRVVTSNEVGTVYGPDRTFTTPPLETCGNESLRGGFSARLPDCRAYELVTPSVKTSFTPIGGETAADGDAVAFSTRESLPGAATGGDFYLSVRGPDGWSPEVLNPLESYSGILCSGASTASNSYVSAYSAQLTTTLLLSGVQTRASKTQHGGNSYESCNTEGLEVVKGEPIGYDNLLLRDNETGSFRLVNAPPAGVTPADAHKKGASADLSHVVFTEEAPLAPGARYGVENLYEWDEGTLRLLTVLPDGTPAEGTLPEAQAGENGSGAISADGSHIVFESGDALYDRIESERTVQIDEKQGGSGVSGGGVLQTVSADGSEVLFTDESKLTARSTAEAGKPDLYECSLAEGATKCLLSDLTSEAQLANAGEHADVLTVSALGAVDSTRVYFTAEGVLATNKRAYEYTDVDGNRHTATEEAKSGEHNLYFDDGGAISFVATLGATERGVGVASPDGEWFAFNSTKSLTGYEQTAGEEEIFLYSALSSQIVCGSCNPSGQPEGGNARRPTLSARPLSDQGQLFFDTASALVPADTNGQTDVYEYQDGRLSLISSGTSTKPSSFDGASESGSDVFFTSTQQLVPQDTVEEQPVIYDARVEGGFPAPASPSPCTTADSCRTPVSPQPSVYGAPSSQTFSGNGNAAPEVASTVQHKQKKAKKKPKKKAKKKPKKEQCGGKGRAPARCAVHSNKVRARAKSHRRGK